MKQATLELDTPKADAADRTGFDIGWDHARHGLVPPAGLLLDGTPVSQGWMAGRAVFGRRLQPIQRTTRQWLTLRLQAWRHGIAFEGQAVTAHYLEQIQATTCPVLRVPLGGTATDAHAAVIERIDPLAGYAAGNLAVLSLLAQQCADGVDALEAQRRARLAELTGESIAGLPAAAWWRIATLRSFAAPLGFDRTARLPLALLPPPLVRPPSAVQRLQAVVTLQFAMPGWSARLRALAAALPEEALRHDFNLLVGALAPRVLEAGAEPVGVRRALEDAWLHERVQRRWQHFALSLGEAGVEALLERACAADKAPARSTRHAPGPAAIAWSPADGGRAARPPMPVTTANRRLRPLPRPRAGTAARPAP